MPGCWELNRQPTVLTAVLHVDTVTFAWAVGLKNLILPGPVIGLSGMPFDHARNAACQKALEVGASHVFFLDSDVIPPHDAVMRLLAHNLPVVAGVYCRRSPPAGVPVMIRNGTWVTEWDHDHPVFEVDMVGSGLLLIRRDVLERLPPSDPKRGKHWFDWRVDCPHDAQAPRENLSEDFSFCFPAGTWVMGNRVKRIEDIRIKDSVVTHSGSLQKVTDVITRFYSGKLVKLTARFIGDITMTPGHRLLVRTKRRSGVIVSPTITNKHFRYGPVGVTRTITIAQGTSKQLWQEAKDVKPGEWVYVVKPKFGRKDYIKSIYLSHFISIKGLKKFDDGLLGYNRTRKDAFRIKPKIEVTEGFCRLLGYYLAEGFTPSAGGKKGSNTVVFAFGDTEKEYIEDCQNLLRTELGAESSRFTGQGCTKITASSRILARLFAALCGNGAYHKHLPRFWTRLSKRCLAELIKGYWRGDGSITADNKKFSMVTMSEQLARDVQMLLLRLEVLCNVRDHKNDYGTVYTIGIPRLLSPRFGKLVDWEPAPIDIVNKRNKWFKETKKHFLVKIQCVDELDFNGEVYNLTVKGPHTYTANAVAVHNCVRVKAQLGIPIIVDTRIMARHVGYFEATYGKAEPLNSNHFV